MNLFNNVQAALDATREASDKLVREFAAKMPGECPEAVRVSVERTAIRTFARKLLDAVDGKRT